MSFLGPVGSLIPVKCASRLTSSGGRKVSLTRTLGKQKAFLGQVTAREWDVEIGLAKPQELSGLRWLAENVNSPMVWYSPDAVVGNVLTPRQADLAPGAHNGLDGPLLEVDHGVWVKSVFSDQFAHPGIQNGPNGYEAAPIPAGATLTCAAWMYGNSLSGRQMLRVQWHDSAGVLMDSLDTDFDVPAGWVRRSVTLTAPVGAAFVRIAPHAEQVAGPSITLTDRLMPYSPGRGATKVVAHGLADAIIRATETQHLQSLSFTISEVG